MSSNFMMAGLVIWTGLTGLNYFFLHKPLMGGIFACYTVANVLLFILGKR